MPINARLRAFLDEAHVPYRTVRHSPAYTAQETAALSHVSGKRMLKCVMFRADGRHYLAVTRADKKVDLEKCRRVLGVREVEIEREDEFRRVFEDCELGAMPPFGNLWGIQTILDDEVPRGTEVAFNAGDHATLVEMDVDDFDRLVHPRHAPIAA